MITTTALLKQYILTTLEQLPEQTLPEVVLFLDYLQYRNKNQEQRQTLYHPVAMGGIWAGIHISDDDIATIRREMWLGFGEEDNL